MRIRLTLTVWVAAMLCGCAVQAQPVLAKYAESKKMDPVFLETAKYVGEYEGLTCWVGEGRKGHKEVLLVDHNLEIMRGTNIEAPAESELLAASMGEGHVALMVADRSRKRQTLLYTALVDLKTMYNEGLTLRDSLGYGRKDRCMLWAAVSPNGRYVATISIVQYIESKQYSTRVRLMDARMNDKWAKEFALGSMSEMCVADDGTIVTLGYESLGEETSFIFNVLDSVKSDTYEMTIKCDPIREMHLAGVVNHHAMALGTFRQGGTTEDDDICGGLAMVSFDIRGGEVGGFAMRPFQNEDINILTNRHTKKVQKDYTLDLISTCGVATTEYGAVIAVGRNYIRTVTEANGTLTDHFNRVGIHIVAVDTTCHMRWTRNIRRNDTQKDYEDLLGIGLLSHGDRVLLFKSESPKLPPTYDIARECKEYEIGDKSNIVFYSIDPEGEVQKTIVEQKTKQTLFRTERHPDGTLMLLSQHGKRSRQADLKLR